MTKSEKRIIQEHFDMLKKAYDYYVTEDKFSSETKETWYALWEIRELMKILKMKPDR